MPPTTPTPPTPTPPPATRNDEPPWPAARTVDAWTLLRGRVSMVLRDAESGPADWREQLRARVAELRDLAGRDLDAALFLMVQAGASDLSQYGAHHAMLCAVVSEACGRLLEWAPNELDALCHAAVTMNVSMAAAQDALVRQTAPLTEAQRALIDGHGEASAELLARNGVDDPLWLEVVRRHNRDAVAEAGTEVAVANRLATLLRRVDIYTAKLASRSGRQAVSSASAARAACLDARGVPDQVGATMLRSMGLYPPGSFVELANGDVAVVVRRGAKAHVPVVVGLRRADGTTYPQPEPRDTGHPAQAVVRGLAYAEARLRVDVTRVLAARPA